MSDSPNSAGSTPRAGARRRLGVDVGGTYTDLVFHDAHRGLVLHKALTTSNALEEGVSSVISRSLTGDELASTDLFLHATTVALNTVLQRNGAKLVLLTTAGFRDVLELRRCHRGSLNDPLWGPPPPLVPRRLRVGIRERIRSDGSVLVPMRADDIRSAGALLQREKVEVAVVVFLHAYRNPVHEIAAERLLREQGFTGDIVVSHRVSSEYREYERTSTATIDGYVRPRIAHYLRRLGERVRATGFGGEMLVTTSGGGAMSLAEADERPVEMLMSGPAAGAVAAAAVSQELGADLAIGADVGGTSFDTTLIRNGAPSLKYEGEIAGFPVQTPWIDVRSIGAGGGSIASVDDFGLLRVGPVSAGSQPGPACYGRGGTDPTATDAAALLGMLGPGSLEGDVRVSIELAKRAVEPLASRLGASVEGAARGVVKVLTASMADAIREITLERGHDPRSASLIVFGGAGPLFGTLIARELDLGRVVVPRNAGVLSAWGLMNQDLMRVAARTVLVRLDTEGLEIANRVASDLLAEIARRRDLSNLASAGELLQEAALEVRYVGQEYPLIIDVPYTGGRIALGVGEILERFLEESGRAYGYRRAAATEILSVRVTARVRLPVLYDESTGLGPRTPGVRDQAEEALSTYSFAAEKRMEFAVVRRDDVPDQGWLDGPAIVTERTTTTYLDAGWRLSMHDSGHLLLERKPSA